MSTCPKCGGDVGDFPPCGCAARGLSRLDEIDRVRIERFLRLAAVLHPTSQGRATAKDGLTRLQSERDESTLCRIVSAARRSPDARLGLRAFRSAIRRAVWFERRAEACNG